MMKGEFKELMAALMEADELLQFPGIEGHYDKASQLLTSIARKAPTALVAESARHALSLAYACRLASAPNAELNAELARLREALGSANAAESIRRRKRR